MNFTRTHVCYAYMQVQLREITHAMRLLEITLLVWAAFNSGSISCFSEIKVLVSLLNQGTLLLRSSSSSKTTTCFAFFLLPLIVLEVFCFFLLCEPFEFLYWFFKVSTIACSSNWLSSYETFHYYELPCHVWLIFVHFCSVVHEMKILRGK